MAYFRSKGLIVLPMASSGIAAILLTLGKIAHSIFKIPIDAGETSTCSISKQSELSQLIREVSLIIWDEAPMTHRYTLQAFECSLRDICNRNLAFGGKMIILEVISRTYFQLLPKGA